MSLRWYEETSSTFSDRMADWRKHDWLQYIRWADQLFTVFDHQLCREMHDRYDIAGRLVYQRVHTELEQIYEEYYFIQSLNIELWQIKELDIMHPAWY